MKKVKRPIFFVVLVLVLAYAASVGFGIFHQYGDNKNTIIKGVKDIRLGIDIQGGVDVTFVPSGGISATEDQLNAAMSVIKLRLAALNINDSETFVDYNKSKLIVRFPWQAGEKNFNPERAVQELGQTAFLKFVEGYEYYDPTVITGSDVSSAVARWQYDNNGAIEHVVSLNLNDSGKGAFGTATAALAGTGGVISIYMDDICISSATVSNAITNGEAVISGNFTLESSKSLADKINSGALPFKLETQSFKTISPTMGMGALDAMLLGGAIAFALIAVYMIFMYKLTGLTAVIALIGQVAGTLAFVSGYFWFMPSNTLTIPGIAGIVLAVGMGVDANIIIAERIKEELRAGRKLDAALKAGYKRAFSAIFDGNITVILVAFVLMGAFGVPSNPLVKLLSPIFSAFGVSPEGTIYSFGLTLVVGVTLNFLMGVLATMLMNNALAKFKAFSDGKLFGGKSTEKERDFVKKTPLFATISGVCIALTIIGSFFGLKLAIEFKGGTIISYSYSGDADFSAAKSDIEEIVGSSVNIQQGENLQSRTNSVTLSFSSNEGLTVDKQAEITNKLNEHFAENSLEILDSNDITPSAGREFLMKCLLAVLVSTVLLVLYIAYRFKKIGGWSAGAFAIVALLHDVIFVFAAFLLFGFDINSNFIAAALTILGYSVNDTIVIYDRIRENRQSMPKASLAEVVNLSSSQSLTRSLRTSITTITAILAVSITAYISNVESILSFTVPLMVGMIAGTYSSVCIAPTLWVWYKARKDAKGKSDKKKTTEKGAKKAAE